MTKTIKVSECPKEVKVAFDHIRKSHPKVTHAIFNEEAQWLYMNKGGKTYPSFGKEINVGILEAAMDAMDNAGYLPIVIKLD